MRKTQGYRTYPAERALPAFLIRFLARLQELGTVPAIDYEVYGRRGSAGARATTPGRLFALAQTTRIFVVRADGSPHAVLAAMEWDRVTHGPSLAHRRTGQVSG